jgi:diguanylate cyclase (GGDEF)-like protein
MTTARLSLAKTRPQRRSWTAGRPVRRLVGDPQAMLALGLVVTTLLIAAVGPLNADVQKVAYVSALFLGAQAATALVVPRLRPTAGQRTLIGALRFALDITYLAAVTGFLRTGEFRPTAALFIPVVALAAVIGARTALLVGAAAIALYILPVLTAAPDDLVIDTQRAIALGGTAVLLSIGTRRSISALKITVRRLGTALARDRRRSRQVAAVEAVGRLLAATGPETGTLERIVSLLRDDLGYDFVSIYLGSSTRMRLAAQLGYDTVIDEFDPSMGVIGRVMRTRTVAFVPDVSADSDYLSASGIVGSEISAPLLADGNLLGVVNVEARGSAELDRSDVETMTLVAERMASALALASERERLAARAELFRRLTSFATTVNGTLDPARVHEAIVGELRDVFSADAIALTVLDRPSGRYVLRALTGEDQSLVGITINPGEGLSGRAIRDRALVVDDSYDPSALPATAKYEDVVVSGVATPLIRDDVVVGALAVIRNDLHRPLAQDELEALPIVSGLVALAITNTFLHSEVTELSVRDPLTGLFNRRHLDAALARMDAARARREPADRERAAAAIFDLDHFGSVNKRYGHQAGDAILRAFGEVLRTRFRGADLVARYGGEEFLAILDGATAEQAKAVADEVRTSFALVSVPGPDGAPLSVTVSAGCAGMGADGETFDELVARADVGLVMAKRSGRNRVVAV